MRHSWYRASMSRFSHPSWKLRARLAVPIVAASCWGCSPDDSASGSPHGVASSADVQDSCSADCAWQARCGKVTAPAGDGGLSCTARCVERLGTYATGLRVDFVKALASCYRALDCGANDDSCTGTALRATGDSLDADLNTPAVRACLAKHDECPGTFTDDVCGFLADPRRRKASRARPMLRHAVCGRQNVRRSLIRR